MGAGGEGEGGARAEGGDGEEGEGGVTLPTPPDGRLYWLPTEPLPEPVEVEGGLCLHRLVEGERWCACRLVRLPPSAWPVRLLVVRRPAVRVRGEWGYQWREVEPLVLRIDADEEALAVLSNAYARQQWDDWTCYALEAPKPPKAGLWLWTGTFTVGWSDDVESLADEVTEAWTWAGEWAETAWPERGAA
jgi:hypothetical protein